MEMLDIGLWSTRYRWHVAAVVTSFVLLSRLGNAVAHEEAQPTALALAAVSGDVTRMKSLFDSGGNVKESTPYGDTLLHLTLRRTSLDRRESRVGMVDLLVSHGAEVNARNRRAVTPLMDAADTGDFKSTAYLVKHRSIVNQGDDQGRTALSLAAYRSYEDIVALLLENGAEIEARDQRGRPALMNAIAAVSAFLPGSPARVSGEKGELSIVRMLLERGAAVNVVDKEGWTPLALATERSAQEIVVALLSRGANVNVQVPRLGNETPLMMAIRNNDPAMMKAILTAKPDLFLTNSQGRTALDYARSYQDDAMVAMLIKAGGAR